MNKSRLFLAFIAVFMGCIACTTMKSSVSRSALVLAEVEKIKPGTTMKDEIVKRFGKPSMESDLTELPSLDDDGILWSYRDGEQNRLSLYFERDSTVVSSVGWQVRNGEKEQSLAVAKERFAARLGTLSFQYRDRPLRQGEEGFEAAYEDSKAGVVVLVQKGTEQVTGLTWSDPAVYSQMVQKWNNAIMSCHHGNDCVWINAEGKQTRIITSPDNIDTKH